MKKLTAVAILFFAAGISSHAQDNYTIKGQLGAVAEPARIALHYMADGHLYTDTVLLANGKFEMTGRALKQPVKATLTLVPQRDNDRPLTLADYRSIDWQDFYLEKGAISVTGDKLKTALIRGGKTQEEYLVLKAQLQPFEEKMQPLVDENVRYMQEKNETGQKGLAPRLKAANEELNTVRDSFIYRYPDSYVSFDLMRIKGAGIMDPVTFEPFFNVMSKRWRQSADGQLYAKKLAAAKRTRIGNAALSFTQNDTTGKPLSLASLKGKYVLIDFWASWCIPCRAENPNLIAAYAKFKNKNFEIISVSLDDKRDLWLKAIKKDGLTWPQVSDLKGKKNAVAVAYGISAIPQNFLVDPQGIIIAKNLRGEEVDKKLSELIR